VPDEGESGELSGVLEPASSVPSARLRTYNENHSL